MAQEPNAPEGRDPSLDAPTQVEVAVPKKNAPKKLAKPVDAAATKKLAQAASLQGKIVRTDTPVPDNTQAADQETIGPEIQKDTNKASEGPVEKPSDSLEASVSAPAGTKAATLLGNYKLLKKLGQGGMGAVYKAQLIKEDRIVAVKVLAKELARKTSYV